ncbi:hypothetical protein Btru_044568 [Bulinus truncatus]|nr:hypothetical protein Btru_044568 [Bulinus truncatus]
MVYNKRLCQRLRPFAPNNVNTMAAAALMPIMALIKFKELWSLIQAALGAVTGSATYVSFLSSVLGAHGKGPGVHLC